MDELAEFPAKSDRLQLEAYDNLGIGVLRQYLSQAEAYSLAAALELQYDVHGARDQATVRRVSPPMPVDAWQHVGELDAWVSESGRWLGRVRLPDGRVVWIDQNDLRPAPARSQTPAVHAQGAG